MINSIWLDLKYAFRQLRHNPGFTFAALLALALGIGANTAIFSTVNGVLLNSMPFRSIQEPNRLMSIYERNPAILAFISERLPVRFKNYLEWKKQNQSFESIAAYQDASFDLSSADSTGHREPEQVHGARATSDFLPLLGVRPRIGRNFTAQEMRAGGGHVALISDDLWRSRFQTDPKIIGMTIRATGAEYQIIGVLQPDFELPATGQGLDQSKPKLWVPMNMNPSSQEEGNMALTVFGRLKRGVTLDAGARRDERNQPPATAGLSGHGSRMGHQRFPNRL